MFNRVKYYCQFIGAVRSGHTLVSQIINSHKDALMSNELNIVEVYEKYTNTEIFKLIYEKDKAFHSDGYLNWQRAYKIGHFQSKTDSPLVIGDKFSGGNTTKFANRNVLKAFMNHIDKPFKFIWVKRDEESQIRSMFEMRERVSNPILEVIQKHFYFQQEISQRIVDEYDTLIIELDDLRNKPDNEIKRMLNYLELSISDDHIEACKMIIK